MDRSGVQIDIRDSGIAVLTLDQPGSRANVLNTELWNELDAAVSSLSSQSSVTGLVLRSAKPGIFIAGADLKFFQQAEPNDPQILAFLAHGLRVLDRLESLPFPSCALIEGAALGGGLEVALACDIRFCVANPKLQIGLPETKLGLIPGWGGTQRLPRLIGLEKAAEMICSGRSLTAEEAAEIDLVLLRTPSDPLEDAITWLKSYLDGDQAWFSMAAVREWKCEPMPEPEREEFKPVVPDQPDAVREAMLVMIRGASLPFSEAIELETEAFIRLAGTEESKQRINEFFASRKK